MYVKKKKSRWNHCRFKLNLFLLRVTKKNLKYFSSLPHTPLKKKDHFDTKGIATALRDSQIKYHLGNFKGLFQQYHFLPFPTLHPFFLYFGS